MLSITGSKLLFMTSHPTESAYSEIIEIALSDVGLS